MDENELLDLLSKKRKDPIFVCRLSNRVATAIGALTTAVWLSSYSADKQETKRNPSDQQNYLLTPVIIENGFVRIEPPCHAIFIYHEKIDKRRSFKVVVKSTRNGNELYLVSVHRADRTTIRATYHKTMSLLEWERSRHEVGPPKNPT